VSKNKNCQLLEDASDESPGSLNLSDINGDPFEKTIADAITILSKLDGT